MQEQKDKKYWKKVRRLRRREKRAEKRRERREKLQHFSSRILEKIKENKRIRKEKAKQAQRDHERRKKQEQEAGGFWAVRRRRIRRFFIRVWRKIEQIKAADRRHFVAFSLIALSVLAAFTVCDLSIDRLVMALGDFKNSVIYYFCHMTNREYTGPVSVNTMPEVDLQRVCPFSIAEVMRKLELLDVAIFSKQMFMAYLAATAQFCRNICIYILMFVPVMVLVVFVIGLFVFALRTVRKDTKPLIFWKKHIRSVFRGVFGWVRDMIGFIKENGYEFWLIVIWLFNLNFATIVVEFFAWYFYFIPSFNFASLGVNLGRLFIDALIMLWSAPWWFWAIAGWLVFDDFRRSVGYNVLRHHEAMNASFFASLPLSSLVIGTMGAGKTTTVTDLGLTGQNYFRRKAEEMMFEIEMKFPNFPIQRFEDAIDGAHRARVIFNKASVRPFIDKIKEQYKKCPTPHNLFGYDLKEEAVAFDDNLTTRDLFSYLEGYAKLYYLYTIESPLICANYAVRCDAYLQDQGNFPLWFDDFFEMSPEESKENEQFCHILDWDTMRRGKYMDKNNPFIGSKEFGIDLEPEKGKERGNQVENKGMKKTDEGVNPLNDGYNDYVKIRRHASTIENFCFGKEIGDEQRMETLGADLRNLSYVIKILEKSDIKIAMPFYALGNLFFALTYDAFRAFCRKLRYRRGDNSFFRYTIMNVYALFLHHHWRVVNTFGYNVQTVAYKFGDDESEWSQAKYYIARAKIYSNRFKTDSYEDIIDRQALKSGVGIEDYPQYGNTRATTEEIHKQHSYAMERYMKEREHIEEDEKAE